MFYLVESIGSYEDKVLNIISSSENEDGLKLQAEKYNNECRKLLGFFAKKGKAYIDAYDEASEKFYQNPVNEEEDWNELRKSFIINWLKENPIPEGLEKAFYVGDFYIGFKPLDETHYYVLQSKKAIVE